MKRINIIILILAVFIVAGGGVFFLIGFLTHGTIETSGSKYFDPSSPRDPELVVFRTDIGNINIKYNTSATPFYVKVDYDIKMSGMYIIGKSIFSFFTLEWDNITSLTTDKISFELQLKPGVSLDPSLWFAYRQIEIDVTLRTDIDYEVEAYVTTGSTEATIPKNVTLDSLYIESTTGSSVANLDEAEIGSFRMISTTGGTYLYAKDSYLRSGIISEATTGMVRINLTNCLLGGNIDADITTGTIIFNSYNTECTGNSNWDLDATTGDIDSEIIQYVDIGGDVQGDWSLTTGTLELDYIDNITSVGGSFTGTITTGTFNPTNSGGFELVGTTTLRSLDYLTANYTFTFGLTVTTGTINVDGESS